MQSRGSKVLRLESGDPSFDIPPHVREAIEKALKDGLTHYTAGAGIPSLREAITEKLTRENQIEVRSPNEVLVTNGAMNALYITFRALIEEPGDEIIVPDPTWTETFDNVTLSGGIPVRCPLVAADGWKPDLERLRNLITSRTRGIVINSPHNPAGAVLSRTDLQRILEIAGDIPIVSDEAYEHVLYDDEKHTSIGSLSGGEQTISIFSMSKSYAMSGLRVGYLHTHNERLLDRMSKLLRCTINGVNSVTQHGAVAALSGPQDAIRDMQKVYQYRRDTLLEGLKNVPFLLPYKPLGAFYVWAAISPDWKGHNGDRSGWGLSNYLVTQLGIGSAPGEVFGPRGTRHVRFAFSCSTSQIEAAASLFKSV